MKRILAAVCFFACLSAQAEEATNALDAQREATQSSTAAFDWSSLFSRVSGSYGALFLGPTLNHLDGNTTGRGYYYSLRNYLSFDYEVARNWEITTGWEVRQTWRPADPRNPNRKDLEARDPSLGVSRRRIVSGPIFSLGADAKYYIPTSESTKSKAGKRWDSADGSINVGINPSWRFLDGDLYVSCSTDFYYNFAERAPKVREDYTLKFKPLVSYRFARKFAAKVEYNSGYLRHSTDGKWTKFNDPLLGQKIYTGVTWSPVRAVSISPSLGWGSETFRLNRAELSLFASYYFL